jgi:hypothetical protein
MAGRRDLVGEIRAGVTGADHQDRTVDELPKIAVVGGVQLADTPSRCGANWRACPAIFSPFFPSKSCTDEAAPSGTRNRGNVYVSILPASARTSLRAHDRQSSRNAACSRDSRIQTMSWTRLRSARARRWSSYPCGSGRWRA